MVDYLLDTFTLTPCGYDTEKKGGDKVRSRVGVSQLGILSWVRVVHSLHTNPQLEVIGTKHADA